jgi:predicted O-methyltransferase YrrM
VVDVRQTLAEEERLWGPVSQPVGLDLNPAGHRHLLTKVFPSLIEGYDYASEGPPDDQLDRFYDFNGQFERQDPRVLFCMLRMIRPRRIIEIGSGYSTLLMMDVNHRYLGGEVAITCVEPHPRPFLRRAHYAGELTLLERRAQDLPVGMLTALGAGDVLFVDSSHVCKTGSDVNRIVLQVLPRLKTGVYIHFHDIFVPDDYPKEWIERGFSWNEQYLLQAFLEFNPCFRVIYGCAIARELHARELRQFLGDHSTKGGSFWLQRCSDWPAAPQGPAH